MKVLWFLPLLLPLHFTHRPTASPNICLGFPVATAPAGSVGSLENCFLCMRERTDMSSKSKAPGIGRLHCAFSGQLICTSHPMWLRCDGFTSANSLPRMGDKTWARPACSFHMPRLAHGLLSGKASTRSRKYHASYCRCLSTYTANVKTVNPNRSWVLSISRKPQKIEIIPSTVISLLPHQWWAHVSRPRNSRAVWAVLVQSSPDPQLGHLSTAIIQHPHSQLPAQLPQTSASLLSFVLSHLPVTFLTKKLNSGKRHF